MIQDIKGTPMIKENQNHLDQNSTSNDLLNIHKRQEDIALLKGFQPVHIVFGDSPTGSLKVALKELGLNQQERIITFSDLFSIGHVWNLHELHGVTNRFKWLKTHINLDDEVLFDYETHFKRTLLNIEQVPSEYPIIIWAGENPHEQTGLRFVLYLLKEKLNDIQIININEAYKTHFERNEIDYLPLYMGELSPSQLKKIYENKRNGHVLTQIERKDYELQWQQLCKTKEVLRIWNHHKITRVPETFFDDIIINTVKKFHQERKNNNFIKAARIIGDVIGHLDNYVGDQFIEYRVRRLIFDGVFDMEGVLTAMRFYSIKLRDDSPF